MEDDVLLATLSSMMREESRRRTTQVVWMVSFFAWLLMLNIHDSMQWAHGSVPPLDEWLVSVFIEGLFAIALASLTLVAARAISHLLQEQFQIPDALKGPEGNRK